MRAGYRARKRSLWVRSPDGATPREVLSRNSLCVPFSEWPTIRTRRLSFVAYCYTVRSHDAEPNLAAPLEFCVNSYRGYRGFRLTSCPTFPF